ncbi:hypothetical protein [Streptomyces sp. BK239]|uniref:hypothetical protein n=1 Tax=Streptomyces sp. BK239 TaxID=2512155 RepID=UPI00102C9EBC|nr:hypothetical protein [Streptomyces sp. BK239]RZU12852.1 hypothetical protein EV567_4957 [Streptomyces sp. BK239]
MLVHHAEPALAAAAATGVILAARFAATRPYTRRRAVGTARRRAATSPEAPARHDQPAARPHSGPTPSASARRTHTPAAARRTTTPHGGVRPAESAVLEAERHVHRCWQRLRAHSDRPDHHEA